MRGEVTRYDNVVCTLMSICGAVCRVVVVCLPRPMEGIGRLQFSDPLTELPDSTQAAVVGGPLNCAFYISL